MRFAGLGLLQICQWFLTDCSIVHVYPYARGVLSLCSVQYFSFIRDDK